MTILVINKQNVVDNKLYEKNESNAGLNNIEDNGSSKITIYFYYKGRNFEFKCNINEKMENIINKFFEKKDVDKNNLYFIYNDKKVDLNLELKQIINEEDKNIIILVHEKKMKIKIIFNYWFLIQLKIKLK